MTGGNNQPGFWVEFNLLNFLKSELLRFFFLCPRKMEIVNWTLIYLSSNSVSLSFDKFLSIILINHRFSNIDVVVCHDSFANCFQYYSGIFSIFQYFFLFCSWSTTYDAQITPISTIRNYYCQTLGDHIGCWE